MKEGIDNVEGILENIDVQETMFGQTLDEAKTDLKRLKEENPSLKWKQAPLLKL